MLLELIKFLLQSQKTDLVLEMLSSLEEKASSVYDLRDLACILSSIGEHEKAIVLAEKAIDIVSDYDERNRILVILCRVYLNACMPEKAKEVFSKVPVNFQIESLKNEISETIKLNENISETGFWKGPLIKEHENFHCLELSQWIADYLNKEKLVLDLGCGAGHYLKFLSENGFKKLLGFEGEKSDYFVYNQIQAQDLTQPFETEEKGNVLCLEVGEHIPKKHQDVLINNICNACDDILILSWAIRGQAGTKHVNCLNNEEVIALIESKGFQFLKEDTISARNSIKDHCFWFKNTILIFKKNE